MPDRLTLTEMLKMPQYQPAYHVRPQMAKPARTLPAPVTLFRINLGGQKPTLSEWATIQANFRANPAQRIRPGTAHPDHPGFYFLCYHKDAPNAERWGSKQQLADRRKSAAAAQARYQKRRMDADPEFKRKKLLAFKEFTRARQDRYDAISEAREEAKAKAVKRAQKSKRRKRAKRQS